MSTNIVENFDNDIKKVIDLIVLDKTEEACGFFNDVVFKKYEKDIRDKGNPLVFFEIFFSEMDDYLNNKGAMILGNVDKNNIVGSYNSDYIEDLKMAFKKEEEKNLKREIKKKFILNF